MLKSIFGGQTDAILATLRKVIKANLGEPNFPLEQIRDEFKSNPNRNYALDDDFIEGLLTSHYESNEAFYVLSLLYPHLDYFNQDFHKDHLHPSSFFRDYNNITNTFNEEDREFCGHMENWNTIPNLQLLNGNLNKSKQDKSLEEWAKANHISNDELFVSRDTDLNVSNFRAFIVERKEVLKSKLKSIAS
ncbi:MAG: hypothetical protein IPM81_02125 [Saprospirales bacterium]|nr:hypothetical protein [Saprospirales bacterium]